MADNTIKQHISTNERAKWNKHIGSRGADMHQLGDGVTPGFSMNSFTSEEKSNLHVLVTNVSDLRITVSPSAPNNPTINKDIWFDTSTSPFTIQLYRESGWERSGSDFS